MPLLEYACELWDGCCSRDADKLEQLQFEAARIITVLPKFVSKESLYFETGWETLSCRQRRRKLTLFHKIHSNIAPEYLQDCLNEYLLCGKPPLANSPKASGNFGWRVTSTLYSPVWRVTVVRRVGTLKRSPR